MQPVKYSRLAVVIFVIAALLCSFSVISVISFAQSKPQKPETTPSGTQKRNQRPTPQTEEERKKAEEAKKQAEEEKNAVEDKEVLRLETGVVNVDTVVYNKKSGQIITGLKKENFAIFENGVKQTITNFATPESPITVSVVVEYSKWSELFGLYGNRGQEAGTLEVIRPCQVKEARVVQLAEPAVAAVFCGPPRAVIEFATEAMSAAGGGATAL